MKITRNEIEKQTELFLKNGGKIEKIEIPECENITYFDYHLEEDTTSNDLNCLFKRRYLKT